jgi:metal-responsive CopG/Arc/MetJ family transcriptional regulator
MNIAIQTQLPENLLKEAELFVKEGGACNLNELVTEALRRYLETHRIEFMEQFVREDIEWGIHGKE